MKKRLISTIIAATTPLALMAGCGSSSSSSSSGSSAASSSGSAAASASAASSEASSAVSVSDESADQSAQGKKVGVSLTTLGNDFVIAIGNTIKDIVESQGATCQIDSCDGDGTVQMEQVENYVTMGMDVIVVFAVNGEAMTQTCQRAMEEGVKVVSFGNEIPDGYNTFCGSVGEYELGEACAQMASEWIDKTFPDAGDGEVNVFLLGSTMSPESVARTDGQKTIENNPKVNLIYDETPDQDNRDEGRKHIENAFTVYPDIDVTIAINGTTALGVESFYMSSEHPVEDLSKAAVFTVDETEEIDAKILSSVDNDSVLRGTISLGTMDDIRANFERCIIPILNDEPYEDHYLTEAFWINPETLAE